MCPLLLLPPFLSSSLPPLFFSYDPPNSTGIILNHVSMFWTYFIVLLSHGGLKYLLITMFY